MTNTTRVKNRLAGVLALTLLGSFSIPGLIRPTFGSDVVEQCRLQESSYPRQLNNHLFTGFPAISKNLPTSGTFTIAIIPVHYRDLPAEVEPLKRVRSDMATFVRFFELQTEGRVKFQWKATETSVLLPGSADELEKMEGSAAEAGFARRVLSIVDPYVDFTGVHSVVFVLPPGSKNRGGIQLMYPMKIPSLLATSEGGIYNFLMAGEYFGSTIRPNWSYWAHELGHAFHLSDLYAQPWSSTAKNIRSFDPPGPFHGWDLMANQDGPSRSINMWSRWVRGWASDAQIECKSASDLSDYVRELLPLETSSPGIKAVIVRFSSTRALVIESRRESEFNLQNDVIDEGVLVYEIDTKFGHGEIPIIPVKRSRQISVNLGDSNPPYFDALLKEGETLRYENLFIKLVKSGERDTIQIASKELFDSDPTPTPAASTPTPTPAASATNLAKTSGSHEARTSNTKHRSIFCVKGSKVKRVKGVRPICPAGYKVR